VKSRQTLNNIQALRALAILLVVMLHLTTMAHQFRPTELPTASWAGIGHAGVDLFFVISGFIMVVIGHDLPQGIRSALLFLYRRGSRVYLPYWFWFLVALALYSIWPSLFMLEPDQLTGLLPSFFLIPTWTQQLLVVNWTLKYELYFYLVCSAILLFPGKWRLYLLAGWLGYLLIGQLYCDVLTQRHCGRWFGFSVHPILLEFLYGCLVAWYYLVCPPLKPHQAWGVLSAGLVAIVCAFAFYTYADIDLDQHRATRAALFGIPSLLMVLGAVLVERDAKGVMPRPAVVLGDASYTCYLIHLPVIQCVFLLLAPVKIIPAVAIMVLAFTITIYSSLVGYRYVERPLIKLARSHFRGQRLTKLEVKHEATR
jgi:peptidoglycan/LPS O-acetylase OafA/YrhL